MEKGDVKVGKTEEVDRRNAMLRLETEEVGWVCGWCESKPFGLHCKC